MKKTIVIISLIVVLMPIFALAQTANVPSSNPCSLKSVRGQNVTSTFPECVRQIYVLSLGVSVLLALLMIVIGGYFVMTSRGNAEQATKGKEYITSALIGVVILFCAYLLLREINPDLVKFNIDSLKGLNRNLPSNQTPTNNGTAPATTPIR
jgi:hypothetical protein